MSNPFDYVVAQITDACPPMQPLHLIDEISHRVVNEYTEAICALGLAATASRDIDVQLALTCAATLRARRYLYTQQWFPVGARLHASLGPRPLPFVCYICAKETTLPVGILACSSEVRAVAAVAGYPSGEGRIWVVARDGRSRSA
jgi:hypothetical protein